MKNPKLIVKPFAKNGQKNVIPENYETSMESNQATWDQGFGQITMLPVAAGGLPPKGQDFNGIFNQISENIVYLSQGGRFKFSAEYAEAIGGYPKGAILQSDDEKKEYLSLIDNNKVDFNTVTDISASWKLVNTDDLLAQIASKQPKGDYATKTELNSGLAGKQPVGDYATKTEVNSKLAKDQNGADIPNKDTFIKNLGLGDVIKSPLIAIPGGADVLTYFPGKPTGFYSSGASMNNTPEPAAWRNFIWLNHGSDRYGQLICLWGGGKIATRSLNAAEWDSKWNVPLSDDDIVESLGQSSSKVVSQKKITEELQAKSLLTKIKEVDGSGSGLDADLVRGLPAEFGSYLTGEGYQKLPSGVIIQWGRKTIGPETIETINFPIAFSQEVFVVVGTQHSANYTQASATISQSSYSKSSFGVRNNSTTNQMEFRYIAIGK